MSYSGEWKSQYIDDAFQLFIEWKLLNNYNYLFNQNNELYYKNIINVMRIFPEVMRVSVWEG